MTLTESIILALNTILLFFIIFRFREKKITHDIDLSLVKGPRELLRPFIKSNGKKKPKVNDDEQAWKAENDV